MFERYALARALLKCFCAGLDNMLDMCYTICYNNGSREKHIWCSFM
jgi:hypothetical protein